MRPFARFREWLPILICLSILGCISPQTVRIHEIARGSVLLESLPGGTVGAAHPASIEGSTLGLVIAGLHVGRDARLLRLMRPNKPVQPIQIEAFSQAEAEFLAPLIATALSRATPDQIVRFHVFRHNTEGGETTGGSLFVKNRSLYVTLTQFRARFGIAPTGSKRRPPLPYKPHREDLTGLKNRRVLFVPKGMRRTELESGPGLPGFQHLETLVLDYELLARIVKLDLKPKPVSPSKPKQAEITAEERSFADRLKRNDAEIRALREKLRSLQEQNRGP